MRIDQIGLVIVNHGPAIIEVRSGNWLKTKVERGSAFWLNLLPLQPVWVHKLKGASSVEIIWTAGLGKREIFHLTKSKRRVDEKNANPIWEEIPKSKSGGLVHAESCPCRANRESSK